MSQDYLGLYCVRFTVPGDLLKFSAQQKDWVRAQALSKDGTLTSDFAETFLKFKLKYYHQPTVGTFASNYLEYDYSGNKWPKPLIVSDEAAVAT